jgi:mutator protein MutT
VPEPLVDVAIALVWRDGRLLVTQRPDGSHLEGTWEFPGGKLAAQETAEACAEREVLEETGVRVTARRVRAVIEHDYPDRSVRLHPVDCDWVGGEPETRGVAAWAWVRPEDLGGYVFPSANSDLLAALEKS